MSISSHKRSDQYYEGVYDSFVLCLLFIEVKWLWKIRKDIGKKCEYEVGLGSFLGWGFYAFETLEGLDEGLLLGLLLFVASGLLLEFIVGLTQPWALSLVGTCLVVALFHDLAFHQRCGPGLIHRLFAFSLAPVKHKVILQPTIPHSLCNFLLDKLIIWLLIKLQPPEMLENVYKLTFYSPRQIPKQHLRLLLYLNSEDFRIFFLQTLAGNPLPRQLSIHKIVHNKHKTLEVIPPCGLNT